MKKSLFCIMKRVRWFINIMDIVINMAEYILTGNIKEFIESVTTTVVPVNDVKTGCEILSYKYCLEDMDLEITKFDESESMFVTEEEEDPFSDEDIVFAQYVEEFEDIDFYAEMTFVKDLEYRFMKTLGWCICAVLDIYKLYN